MTPWTVAHQAPLSMGLSRQGYWSGLPVPSPGDFSIPGIEPRCPALKADALLSEPPREWGEGRLLSLSPSPVGSETDPGRQCLSWTDVGHPADAQELRAIWKAFTYLVARSEILTGQAYFVSKREISFSTILMFIENIKMKQPLV